MGRSKKDTGNWLMTYSDMVTLLLVFFVVLYMLTPGVDLETLNQFLQRFRGGIGVMQKEQTVIDQLRTDRHQQIMRERMERWEELIEYIEDNDLGDFFDIALIPEGIRITLSESVTFNSGSSDLLPQAQLILNQIAGLFSEDIYETEIQGHTDNVPLRATAYYRSNWDLGAARSVQVLRFIKGQSGLQPEVFKASSYGEFRPIADNNTEEGRQANRRVEIYIRYDDAYIDLSDQEPLWQQGLGNEQ